MAKDKVLFGIELSDQAEDILERLVPLGCYGHTPAEVGGRLLEQVIADRFMVKPVIDPRNISGRKRK
jgi:hypothetical protein